MLTTWKPIFIFLILILLSQVYQSCKDMGSAPPIPHSTIVLFGQQVQPIFTNSCSCHTGNNPSANLNLSSGNSYAQLVSVQSTSSCTGLKRVLPSKADSSTLYLKITGSSCGTQMPLGGSLSLAEVNLFRDWINQGAHNN